MVASIKCVECKKKIDMDKEIPILAEVGLFCDSCYHKWRKKNYELGMINVAKRMKKRAEE